jgi:hypothetical protein
MYVGFLKDCHVHPEKHAGIGSYNKTIIASFVCSVYSLSGPFSLLWEP